ncbi:MAG TPA: methylmalonyl Co-A mutase-associated GTPase MeaB, partial [Bacteroidales bacterium]|nr:methylmalonyl Co-A mutase-associated GTPase MeaB [Bacteroidales bacterium]
MNPTEHPENSSEFPGLRVNSGVGNKETLNTDSVNRFKQKRTGLLSVEAYISGIRSGDRSILGKAITLVESSLHEHRPLAEAIIEACIPFAGNSLRIGITGVPGVGKSSFIETAGSYIVEQGYKLAVLAIDPSSERSKGSILG